MKLHLTSTFGMLVKFEGQGHRSLEEKCYQRGRCNLELGLLVVLRASELLISRLQLVATSFQEQTENLLIPPLL